jgi:hypothetical protein
MSSIFTQRNAGLKVSDFDARCGTQRAFNAMLAWLQGSVIDLHGLHVSGKQVLVFCDLKLCVLCATVMITRLLPVSSEALQVIQARLDRHVVRDKRCVTTHTAAQREQGTVYPHYGLRQALARATSAYTTMSNEAVALVTLASTGTAAAARTSSAQRLQCAPFSNLNALRFSFILHVPSVARLSRCGAKFTCYRDESSPMCNRRLEYCAKSLMWFRHCYSVGLLRLSMSHHRGYRRQAVISDLLHRVSHRLY